MTEIAPAPLGMENQVNIYKDLDEVSRPLAMLSDQIIELGRQSDSEKPAPQFLDNFFKINYEAASTQRETEKQLDNVPGFKLGAADVENFIWGYALDRSTQQGKNAAELLLEAEIKADQKKIDNLKDKLVSGHEDKTPHQAELEISDHQRGLQKMLDSLNPSVSELHSAMPEATPAKADSKPIEGPTDATPNEKKIDSLEMQVSQERVADILEKGIEAKRQSEYDINLKLSKLPSGLGQPLPENTPEQEATAQWDKLDPVYRKEVVDIITTMDAKDEVSLRVAIEYLNYMVGNGAEKFALDAKETVPPIKKISDRWKKLGSELHLTQDEHMIQDSIFHEIIKTMITTYQQQLDKK